MTWRTVCEDISEPFRGSFPYTFRGDQKFTELFSGCVGKELLCKSFRKFLNKLKRTPNPYDSEFTEATPGIEPGMKVLQTRALPLGYVAMLYE